MNGSPATSQEQAAPAGLDGSGLLAACRNILAPLARLAVERGVQFAQLDELLRSAFVEAALEAHPDVAAHRAVSRISATTGLNRREVTRLLHTPEPEAPRKRSPATEVFTRWLSDPKLRRGRRGTPKLLPRQGPYPSFEALAQSVTRDVHPRSLLEEMCRLGLARVDETSDSVELLRDTFVPAGDEQRLFGFLGANVGDHLSAAVANVTQQGPRRLEQALFADELSRESIDRLQPLISEQWQSLVRDLAPLVQQCIDEDEAAGRMADQRLRVGMYAHAAAMPARHEDTTS